jgi:hypothetical protein
MFCCSWALARYYLTQGHAPTQTYQNQILLHEDAILGANITVLYAYIDYT